MAESKKQEKEEQAEALVEKEKEEEEDEEIEEIGLPFPKATIVNMVRDHLSPGKQIKGQVKREMNIWLGKIVERIAQKMDAYPYTYVDGSMFREAIEPYEKVQEIEIEKERIIKQLDSIKSECDVLISEVDRQFVLRKGTAYGFLEAAKKSKKE